MKPPLNIHLYITSYCAVPCRHCYYEALKPGAPYLGQLSAARMADVIGELNAEFDIDVHLEGGEAFLSDDLGELLETVPAPTWRKITITTSGTVMPRFDVQLLQTVGDLRISIEGANSAQHSALRGIQLDRTEAFMQTLKQAGVPFSIRSTLFSDNWEDWPALVQYARKAGATHLSCYELQSVGRAHRSGGFGLLSCEQFDQFLVSLNARNSEEFAFQCLFQFPQARLKAVHCRADSLGQAGWNVRHLPDTPSLTINPNGDLGISPWKITAQHISDRIGNVTDPAWVSHLQRAHRESRLHDDSASTSRVRISSR